MCNLSWTPYSSLEKDNSLNHSGASPQNGLFGGYNLELFAELSDMSLFLSILFFPLPPNPHFKFPLAFYCHYLELFADLSDMSLFLSILFFPLPPYPHFKFPLAFYCHYLELFADLSDMSLFLSILFFPLPPNPHFKFPLAFYCHCSAMLCFHTVQRHTPHQRFNC